MIPYPLTCDFMDLTSNSLPVSPTVTIPKSLLFIDWRTLFLSCVRTCLTVWFLCTDCVLRFRIPATFAVDTLCRECRSNSRVASRFKLLISGLWNYEESRLCRS